jgi:hypothetical protein
MADSKISALTELTALASADELVAVDKSDTSMAASGTTKRLTLATLRAEVPFIDAVAEHGVPTDGTTDGTTAINAAITAANAEGGGIVYLRPLTTTYRFSQIVMKDGVWLMGGGVQGTELRSIASNPTAAGSGLIVLSAITDENVFLSDFMIHGLRSSQTNAINGINFDKTGDTGEFDSRIWHLDVIQCKGAGMRFTGRSGPMLVRACRLGTNDGHGVHVLGNASDCSFVDVDVGNSGLNGFHIEVGNNVYQGCTSHYSGQIDSTNYGDGFHLTSTARHTQMNMCRAEDGARHGFYFNGCNDLHAVGVMSSRCNGNAFRFTGVTDSEVEGKVVFQNEGTGNTHSRIVEMDGSSNARNRIEVGYSTDALDAATAPVNGTATGNDVKVSVGGTHDAIAAPAYAASFTPDPYLYAGVSITLTGNITINAPTYQHRGQRLRLILTQDGTGGHTMSFNAVFKTHQAYTLSNVTTDRTFNANSYTMDELADLVGTHIQDQRPSTAANAVNIFDFWCDGTNWLQVGGSTLT